MQIKLLRGTCLEALLLELLKARFRPALLVELLDIVPTALKYEF